MAKKDYGQEYREEIERLKAELAKERAEKEDIRKELEILNRLVHGGFWVSYFNDKGETESAVYSDEFRRMLNVNKEQLPDDIAALGSIIHPEDVERVFALFGQAAADKTNRIKYDIDYRLEVRGEGYKWFHAVGEPIRYPDGRPKVFLGSFTDIDQQRKTEEALKISRTR